MKFEMKLNFSITDDIVSENYYFRVKTVLKEFGLADKVVKKPMKDKEKKISFRLFHNEVCDNLYELELPESIIVNRMSRLAHFIEACQRMKLRIVFEPALFATQPNEYDIEFYNTYRE